MRCSSRRHTYTSLASNASSHSPMASRGIPSLSTTPSQSGNHPRVQPSPCVHRARLTLLRCPKPSQPAHDAGCSGLLAALSLLLTTNLSDSIFGDVLGTLQMLAHAAVASTHVTRSSLPSQKRPRSMNRNRLPLLCALTLGLAGAGGGGALP
jgi:hypothetical protein